MTRPITIILTAIAYLALAAPGVAEDKSAAVEEPSPAVREALSKAKQALEAGKFEQAVALATDAIKQDPKRYHAHYLRALAHERLDQHEKAIADYTTVIKLVPKSVEAHQRRGSEYFKSGKIKESIDDFDQVIKLNPKSEPHHWQRGISYYYAKRYKDGVRQFDVHQTVNSADVENAVWRFICMARDQNVEKATRDLLKIGYDSRVPMQQIYDLFAGKAKPEDVLTAAKAGDPPAARLNQNLFYAHLYLGLYHEAHGRAKDAKHHIDMAAKKHKLPGHYMWHVARVHADILEKAEK